MSCQYSSIDGCCQIGVDDVNLVGPGGKCKVENLPNVSELCEDYEKQWFENEEEDEEDDWD